VRTPPLGRWQGQLLDHVDEYRLIAAVRDLLAQPAPEKSGHVAHLRFFANPYFVGREETLNEIHEKLFTSPTAVLTQGHITAITALGGVGKTALARQYAEKFWRCYRQMFWVDCRRGLDGEFALIHDVLRPDPVFAALKDTDKAIWVRSELNQPARPLRMLILDNAEDAESVREWIPKSGNCHTLLTSRFTAWPPGVETCAVWILKPEAAQELLLRRSGKAADEACAAVAGKLGYLSLALSRRRPTSPNRDRALGLSIISGCTKRTSGRCSRIALPDPPSIQIRSLTGPPPLGSCRRELARYSIVRVPRTNADPEGSPGERCRNHRNPGCRCCQECAQPASRSTLCRLAQDLAFSHAEVAGNGTG
jgi:hypothetical protein